MCFSLDESDHGLQQGTSAHHLLCTCVCVCVCVCMRMYEDIDELNSLTVCRGGGGGGGGGGDYVTKQNA